jgi:hypothetical protein
MRRKKKKPTEPELSADEIAVLRAVDDEGPDGFLIPEGTDEEVKEWLDCGWKRIPCGKRSCPLCGRVARDRERLTKEGIDPDSIEGAFESVGANFAEVLTMLKKDAEEMGIEIENLDDIEEAPGFEEFPLVVSAQEFCKEVLHLYQSEDEQSAPWLMTEAAADLVWYTGIFHAKLYRQYCNRWHKERGDGYGDFDHTYTAGVLRQVIFLLTEAFQELEFEQKLGPFRKRFEQLVRELDSERGMAHTASDSAAS